MIAKSLMQRFLCVLASISLVFIAAPLTALAATYTGPDGQPLQVASCTLVDTRSELQPRFSVYTLNPDHVSILNESYRNIWGRDARCDELQFHVVHNTTKEALTRWLIVRARLWYQNLASSPFEGRTISTSRREWFLVAQGTLRRIPDWLTAMSWGLHVSERASIPPLMTDAFYRLARLGPLVQYAEGPWFTDIEERRINGTLLPSAVPDRVADEVAAFTNATTFGNIFFQQQYRPRSSNDAYAKLLDWSWLAENPEEDFTVAFIGDQGNTGNSRAVLELIRDKGASMVIHSGDFDYLDNPTAWDGLITAVFGRSFPYLASVGNHDIAQWSGYKEKILARQNRVDGLRCSGEPGVKSTCTYRGLFFVLSGVGTMGTGHEDYLASSLAASTKPWKICSWHKNQRLMQVEAKTDEVGWEAFELCRNAGAMIINGHAHVYARTHLLSSFADDPVVASTSSTLRLAPGRSFVAVSGLGGHSSREQNVSLAEKIWWASVYTKTQNAAFGALFCVFNKDGDPKKTSCYFQTIAGDIIDAFDVTRP